MKITDMDIMSIENEARSLGDLTVIRRNIEQFEVYQNGKKVFEGEDYEVAEFINHQA